MAQKTPSSPSTKGAQSREDRLKAALKANLARRKQQARSRAEDTNDTSAGDTGKTKG